MIERVASNWTALWQTLTRFQKDKVTPWIGLRNTVGVLIPLVAGLEAGSIAAGLAVATGALNVSYSDSHDPYRWRARKMLATSFLVAFAVFFGTLLGKYHLAAIAVAGLWAFAAGMLVAVNQSAADLGTISLVTLLVYSAVPQTPERAAYAGLLALGGGLFQTSLSLLFWPLRRYMPERRALSDLLLELSRAASQPARVLEAPPASAQSTRAQNILSGLQASRSLPAERYLMLLSQAERMRLSLLTMARLRARMEREDEQGPEREIVDRFLAASSAILLDLGHYLVSSDSAPSAVARANELEPLIDQLGRLAEHQDPKVAALIGEAARQMESLAGQLRTSLELVTSTSPSGLEAFERREDTRGQKLRLAGTLATLRANLTLSSTTCRHALRLAVCVAIGDLLARAAGLSRAYWLPMTVCIVLKPDFSSTYSRGILRLLGTYLGLVLATGIFHVFPDDPGYQIAVIGLLMFILRWIGGANYGIFVTDVTALVVLLIALAGVSPKDVIVARAVNTVAGGAIALIAYGLWPTWERKQHPEFLARLLDAYREYFHAVRSAYLQPEKKNAHELDDKRVAARLARSNLEASVDRASAEPGAKPEKMQTLNAILASSHRLVHAMMALESGLTTSTPVPPRAPFEPFAKGVEATLKALADMLRGIHLAPGALPDLRDLQRAITRAPVKAMTDRYALVNVETDRITNSLNTLREEILKWLA